MVSLHSEERERDESFYVNKTMWSKLVVIETNALENRVYDFDKMCCISSKYYVYHSPFWEECDWNVYDAPKRTHPEKKEQKQGVRKW